MLVADYTCTSVLGQDPSPSAPSGVQPATIQPAIGDLLRAPTLLMGVIGVHSELATLVSGKFSFSSSATVGAGRFFCFCSCIYVVGCGGALSTSVFAFC